jgi:O-antigen/teichoic acid export membrane protein
VSIGALGLIQVVGLSAGLLVHVAAARSLPADVLGLFVSLVLITMGFQTLFAGGVPYAMRRTVSIDPALLRGTLRWLLHPHLPICLAGVSCYLAVALTGAVTLGREAVIPVVLLLAGEILIRSGIFDPCLAVCNGLGRYQRQGVLAVGYLLTRAALLVLCFSLGGGLFAAVLGLTLAAGIWGVAAAASVWGLARQSRADDRRPSCPEHCLGNGFGYEVAYFLKLTCHLWLVDLLVDNKWRVAGYATCYMFSRAALAGSFVASGASYAALARAFAAGDTARAGALVRGGLGLLLAIFLPALAVVQVLGGTILEGLCGSWCGGFGGLFAVTFLGFQLLALTAFLGEVLGAAGQLRVRTSIMMVTTLLDLALIVALVAWLEVMSAALALVVSGLVGLALTLVAVSRLLGSAVSWRVLGRVVTAPLWATCFFSQ